MAEKEKSKRDVARDAILSRISELAGHVNSGSLQELARAYALATHDWSTTDEPPLDEYF